MTGLPPGSGALSKNWPAAAGGVFGDTIAFEPSMMTPAVAAVVMPTSDAAAITVLTEVAANAEGRRRATPSFMVAAPPYWPNGPSDNRGSAR